MHAQPAVFLEENSMWAVVISGMELGSRKPCGCVLANHFQRGAEKPIEIGCERLLFGNRLPDRVLRCGPLVAEIDQRRKNIVHRWSGRRARGWRHREVFQFVLQLDNKALRQLFADARNPGKLCMILGTNCLYGALGRQAAQDLDRQLRSDTAHRDQTLKEPLFLAIEKSEERDLILAHLRVDVQAGLSADAGQSREGRYGNGDVISNAGGVDNGLTRLFVNELAAKMSDHLRLLYVRDGREVALEKPRHSIQGFRTETWGSQSTLV